jgi:hypothetical protein
MTDKQFKKVIALVVAIAISECFFNGTAFLFATLMLICFGAWLSWWADENK